MEKDAEIPLLDRAAIIVAASIWYHEDVIETTRKSIYNTKYLAKCESLVKMESIVKENILTLPLTAVTKQRVKDLSIFVGKDIMDWTRKHGFLNIHGTVLSNLISWSPKCTIDCIATAKKIISYERNAINRFRIACMYCLENYIFKLWDLVEHHYLQYETSEMECFEVRFWISYIKNEMDSLMNEMQYIGNEDISWFAFNVSVTSNNEIWIEHFLKKMKEDQLYMVAYNKVKYILETYKIFNYSVIPILSQYIRPEMFKDLALSYPGVMLFQFLQFPYTDQFIQIANITRNVLVGENFYNIIETIGHYLQEYAGNKIYKNILEQFWRNSPDHCKIYVIRKCIDGSFLNRLGLRKYSSSIIKLTIQSSSTNQRKEMIFSYNGILFLNSLVQKNRQRCFSMSLEEFVGSEIQEKWINELISTYKHIFKMNRFLSLTSKDFEKLIEVLEKQKDKNLYLK